LFGKAELTATLAFPAADDDFVEDVVEYCDTSLHVTGVYLQLIPLRMPEQFGDYKLALSGVVGMCTLHGFEGVDLHYVSQSQGQVAAIGGELNVVCKGVF
jgi:hypothetical protein